MLTHANVVVIDAIMHVIMLHLLQFVSAGQTRIHERAL